MNVLLALAASGTLSLFLGVWNQKKLILPIIVIGLLAAMVFNAMNWNTNQSLFNHMMIINNYSVAFTGLVLFLGLVLILFYDDLSAAYEFHLPEIYALIVYALCGAVVMLSYGNLLMLFLGIEILSLSFYVLTGLRKRNIASNEAAIKYFLMGAFSTGFFLLGITFIYGASVSFSLDTISIYVLNNLNNIPTFFLVGVLLILVSLLFKIAAAPFHFWTPDVYEGAPTLITALMATVGKIASFGAFFILFNTCFVPLLNDWNLVIWIAALLSMTIGNILAIQQNSVKRMLAYSSISHAGFMLLALLSMNSLSSGAIFFYSLAYGLASMSSFIVVMIIRNKKGSDDISSFNGLAKENKILAFVLSVSMLSLAGIPGTAGFFGKFYMFGSAMQSLHFWLVAFAIINSFIAAYYYLRPVVAAYLNEGDKQIVSISSISTILLFILSILTILFGIVPGILVGAI
jgi:NADH-quinone oxidoreductase subunit N